MTLKAAPALFAIALLTAGCGGGGASSTSRGLVIPAQTTTYTGDLLNNKKQKIGTISMTINPDSTFSATTDTTPSFTASGTVFVPPATQGASFTGTLHFAQAGTWFGVGVDTSTTYTIGGSFDQVTSSAISGGFDIEDPATSTGFLTSFFSGTSAP